MGPVLRTFLAVAAAAAVAAGGTPATAAATSATSAAAGGDRAPIVLFPAFHLTKLRVDVRGQHTDASCPARGSFEDWYQNTTTSAFSQVCRDELMTLTYRKGAGASLGDGFREQPGVHVRLLDYGKTASAPFYRPMFRRLAQAGWRPDRDVRVAGYDSRLSPDQAGFLARTKRLVEQTSQRNGGRRVWLVGHSNGPIYAQYLLTHTSRAWRARYVAGFTPLAGNFPGQGLLYPVYFTGLNVTDFGFPSTRANARSSARMYLSQPSTYLSSADPKVFGRSEKVLTDLSTGRDYTPADHRRLFRDAHLPQARAFADRYIGSVPFADPAHYPDVDVWAERGTHLPTVVGAALPSLRVGQVVTKRTTFYEKPGDSNQEDTTNTAVLVWRHMRGHHFSLTANRGVGHFDLPSDPGVLDRLVAHAGHAG